MHDLTKALSGERRYLVITVDGAVELLTIEGWTERHGAVVAMDLAKALRSYRELVAGKDDHRQWDHAEIATEMLVSVNTVKTHLKAIYRKLGVDRRRDAVLCGRRAGLL